MSGVLAFARPLGTFPGGIHPPDEKGLAADAPIEVLPTPAEVRIALLQHLGAPCEAAVKPRAEVHPGDVIGRSEAFVSAPVHASIAGTVLRDSVATLPNGRHVTVIPIRAAESQPLAGDALRDDLFGGSWPLDEVDRHDPREIAEAARSAGLVGMGGAAFPTHVKLMRNDKKPIDTLLMNGCECEPFLTADYRLMLEAPIPLVAGTLLAQRAAGAERAAICIEDNKPQAIEALRSAAAGTPIEVRVLKTKYPQGGERQLVLAATGRVVPGGGLPLEVGVVVMNIATAAALAGAVFRRRPLTHRVVTVSGRGIRHPKNLLVPIGATYGELIRYCGGVTEDAARVIAGGPMMGFTLGAADEASELIPTPVTKGTSGITILSREDVRRGAETACIRCGRCVEICPMRLVPTRLGLAARAQNRELLARYHVAACVECGCCAYVCPASIPLVQLIRVGKLMSRK
jgi:electron transport complex protein RnfC